MGYSWLMATCYNCLYCQHVGANRGREAVGADILILLWVFNLFVFMLCYLNCCMGV